MRSEEKTLVSSIYKFKISWMIVIDWLMDSDFLILFESILQPVKKQNISVTFSSKKYELPGYLVKEITKRIESIKKHSKAEGFDFFDDRVARLDEWSFNKNDDDGILRLHFSETSYYYFAAMNLGLELQL